MPLTALVVSDSHGRADLLARAYERARPDVVLFLGDGQRDLNVIPDEVTLRAVRGNCDWSNALNAPLLRVEQIAGYRIFMTHGHEYGVKWSIEDAVISAAAEQADVLLYGHTHIPFEKTYLAGAKCGKTVLKKPLLVLCPGSVGEPPDGIPSFATLTLAPAGVLAGFGKL